jgi:1-deoxy-D-xylulose-5-phosphate synthase
MSISPNVGGMSNYLARILSGKVYSSMRQGSKKVLQSIPSAWELARRAEEHVKGMVIPGTLFEELGFNYIGPVDGHDLDTLIKTLKNLKTLQGPQFLHIVTRKGKGYAPAEDNPCGYHGVGRFNPETGEKEKAPDSPPTYTEIFSDWLCDMAAADERLIGITPAMREGSGLVRFSEQFPERYYDVGIAEQHAVTLAAGLAFEGFKPVVAIYSTFLQRAYDQLIHDIALQNLPVLFAIDRAGFVGNDGATHDGIFDLSYLRCIPNLVVMAPSDEEECRRMLATGLTLDGPSAVRYPRGTGPGVVPSGDDQPLAVGRGQVRREGRGVALLAFGSLLAQALEIGDALDATVADMRFVKPLDDDLVDRLAADHDLLVTLEENVVAGGAGSAVAEHLHRHGGHHRLLQLGIPDRFFAHGNPAEVLADAGLDSASLRAAIDAALAAGTGEAISD